MDPNRSVVATPARSTWQRLRRQVVGQARDPLAPDILGKVSLTAFFAWIGLGASALSASTYGPDEAFRALHDHTYLAVILAGAIAFTISVKSYAYSRIIEHFPFGGGGYIAATKLLGAELGLVSGAALLVDHVLAISVSIAAAADASFSFLPTGWQGSKMLMELVAISVVMVMNLRGVRESISIIMPIFLLFLVTHLALILGTLAGYAGEIQHVAWKVHVSFKEDLTTLSTTGMAALFLHAYGRSAGTYTGIETIANGFQLMRKPQVRTARRAIFYTSASLVVIAAGILVCYLLVQARPVDGRTMNAVLTERFAGSFTWGGLPVGRWFVILTLTSEAAILIAAAQSSFIVGPRVMANMAADSWLPHRFSHLSDRLTMQNGVVLVSVAAILTLLYTKGETSNLVVIYSINVFISFLLSQLAMIRYWFINWGNYAGWWRQLANHVVGLALCISILEVNLFSKFRQGGGAALVLIAAVMGCCLWIRRHYHNTEESLRRLDEPMLEVPNAPSSLILPQDTDAPTAVCFVKDYNGLGIQSVLGIPLLFGTQFENFVFIGAGIIDSSSRQGVGEIENLRKHTEQELKKYVALLNRHGYPAEYCYALGTDPIDELEALAHLVSKRFPRVVFFASKLIFQKEHFWHKLLHNQAAFTLERRLQFAGLQTVVLAVTGDAATAQSA